MATQVKVAREFNYRVASRMEAGMDAVKEVSMAKNFACQVCDKVVYTPSSFTADTAAPGSVSSSGSTDSRILSIGGGRTEIMKEIISRVAQF
jgi:acyl-CoA dehydrogenase